jgi:alkanesulfonate monooxygenase SsuD/methylene tetrahydromethanopterin reductase-like flavin-dependent oxidoreductase (luciferase family)
VSGDPERVAHKFDVLRQHCERVGRPVDAVIRSADLSLLIAANERELAAKKERFGDQFHLIGTAEGVLEGMRRYAAVGTQYITFHMPDADEVEPILLLGEQVVPEAARI